MPYIRRARITGNVTVSGGGAQTFQTSGFIGGGYVDAIIYTKATVSGFSTAGNMTVTAGLSSMAILNVTTTGTSGVAVSFFPRGKTVDVTGAPMGPASGASVVGAAFPAMIPLADGEYVKVVMSSGGTASNGGVGFTVDLYVGGGH